MSDLPTMFDLAEQKWPTNKLCGKCGKVNCWNKECCGQDTIELGNLTKIPQKGASKKAWKEFCDEIGVDISELEFLKKKPCKH